MAEAYTDGASRGNPGRCAYAFVLVADGEVVREVGRYMGLCTNNEAEYRAVISALEEAARLGWRAIDVYSDSKLVVSQLNGSWKVKDGRMRALREEVLTRARSFDSVRFINVPRENPLIRRADRLCNKALDEASDHHAVDF